MPYEKNVDRSNPGCFLFLVDQSDSMNEVMPVNPPRSKATALAEAINTLLYELVLRCIKDPSEGPRHYYDVGVIGYGSSVGPALGGALEGEPLVSIADIANHPLRVEQRGGNEAEAARRANFPVWFDTRASNGTPMCGAIDLAGSILAPWVRNHPTSFPPIVINISDGAASDGDPRAWGDRLRSLSTADGNVLFFNINLSALSGATLYFPASPSQLNDEYARVLFDMSSPLPKFMRELALEHHLPADEGSRGFVFNAGMVAVITFLRIGTATQHLLGERNTL
jgi:hypothetical protein